MERADATRDYIRDIVWRMLNRPVGDVSCLAAIVDGCRDLEAADLFALNHDRLQRGVDSLGIG